MPIVKNDVQILTYALSYVVQCGGEPWKNFKELMKCQVGSLTEYELKMLIKECISLRECFGSRYNGRNMDLVEYYANKINSLKEILDRELRRREEKKVVLTADEKTVYLLALHYAMMRSTSVLNVVVACAAKHIEEFSDHDLKNIIGASQQAVEFKERFLRSSNTDTLMRLQTICKEELDRRGELS